MPDGCTTWEEFGKFLYQEGEAWEEKMETYINLVDMPELKDILARLGDIARVGHLKIALAYEQVKVTEEMKGASDA